MICPYLNTIIRPLKYFREYKKNEVLVKTKEINYENAYIKENLKVPILYGTTNGSILNNINSNIENDVIEFKKQMEEAAKEYAEEKGRKGEQFSPYSISNIYTVTFNEDSIISISIIYYELIDNKRYYIRTTYNYNLDTGRSMSIGDLFKEGVNYTQLINMEIRRKLQDDFKGYFPGAAENFKGIAKDQPFYIENGELVLFFGFNEIAPIVSEIPVIKLPFSLFSGYIKQQFL